MKRPKVMHKIRVLLADDHSIIRDGLTRVLQEQPDLQVIGEALDGRMAVDLARRLQPDVILMDVNMPNLNGIEATRLLATELPQIRVIGLSMFEDAGHSTAMRQAGAVSFLTKSGPSKDLVTAIRHSVGARRKPARKQMHGAILS